MVGYVQRHLSHQASGIHGPRADGEPALQDVPVEQSFRFPVQSQHVNGGSTRAVTPQSHFVWIPVERADVFLDPAQRLHDVFQTVVTRAGFAARAQESWMRMKNWERFVTNFGTETGAPVGGYI